MITDDQIETMARAMYEATMMSRVGHRGDWQNMRCNYKTIWCDRAATLIATLESEGWTLARKPIGAPVVKTVNIKRRPWYRRIFL